MNKSLEIKSIQALDITDPMIVQVEIDTNKGVLYVHVNGISVLRVCRIGEFGHLEMHGGILTITSKEKNMGTPFAR